jgi:hypothetical protein
MYNSIMKNIINKLTVPMALLIVINLIGLSYHYNYEGAIVGSVIGMLIAFLANEIRAKFE